MTDAEIVLGLGRLGIDKDSYEVLILLPLVQVAWADGKIQKAERKLIVDIAARNGLAEGPARELFVGWLEKRPTDRYFARARHLLMALAHRERGLGSSVKLEQVADLIDLCEEVARAAGGLFGAFPVHVNERRTITEIVDEIGVPPTAPLEVLSSDWADLDAE